jgi:hypothetical protein
LWLLLPGWLQAFPAGQLVFRMETDFVSPRGLTYEQIAELWGVSAVRVRQIEQRARIGTAGHHPCGSETAFVQ